MALHAAREHGVSVVGVTLSQEQAGYARKRIADEGLTDKVEIRVQDYRDVSDGPFDAIVLSGSVAELPQSMLDLLKPGGRLLGIVGDEPVMRATLVRQSANGRVVTQPWDTGAPRLLNFPEPPRFRF